MSLSFATVIKSAKKFANSCVKLTENRAFTLTRDSFYVIDFYYKGLLRQIKNSDFEYSVTSIVIPEGVEIIGGFSSYWHLTSVTLPSTLKAICMCAFCECRELAMCNLPEGLEYIGIYAFQETTLTSLSLPKGLEVTTPTDSDIKDFTQVFSGAGIKKSLALQKLLKETKPKKLNNKDFYEKIKKLYGSI